jgi:hypothetical protein
MSTQGDAGALGRVVTKVVITYRTADDPQEQELTLEHGGRGESIDGVVWGEELMKKLAYLDGDGGVEPKKGPGTGDWKVYSAAKDSDVRTVQKTEVMKAQTSAVRADCIWVHDDECMWWKYCAM